MKNVSERRWMGKAAVFLCLMALAACSTFGGDRSGPPPSPVAQQPDSGASEEAPPAAPTTPSPPLSGPRPAFYDFTDIPVPSELSLVPSDSYVFQAGALKTGLLTLKGRVDINSIINFFQVALPREGWKPKGGFRYKRSVLIFEKPDKTCIINLYEATFYTYVEIYVAPMTGQF